MTSPNGWDAAEAARLRRFTEPERHVDDCDCAACLLEHFEKMCIGEVDAT